MRPDAGTAAEVSGWVTSDREALLWCSAPSAPVPAERVARLAVAPASRSRGVGRDLVRRLTALAREHFPSPWSSASTPTTPPPSAAAAVLGSGGSASEEEAAWDVGQPVAYAWLRADPPG